MRDNLGILFHRTLISDGHLTLHLQLGIPRTTAPEALRPDSLKGSSYDVSDDPGSEPTTFHCHPQRWRNADVTLLLPLTFFSSRVLSVCTIT